MSIDPVKQVNLMVYDYLYNKGLRIEKAYFDEVDRYYNQVNHFRYNLINRDDMLRLIELETAFKTFTDIQKDLYEILRSYDSFVKSDDKSSGSKGK